MVNSIIKSTIAFALLVAGVGVCAKDLECVFRPVFMNVKPGENPYELGSEDLSTETRDNLMMILKYYGKDVEVLGQSNLKISCDLYSNLDFLVSVTKKSQDKTWLELHERLIKQYEK
ncbi:hypothetical protein [Microbulbifer variabilis]|uniref:hypothetical protein n=1 Tax=Microbulbifer variabilis TaxID=266805 RepID=UPI001CFDA520|nr:hypothetical protein [Microbulbifer variabilis]